MSTSKIKMLAVLLVLGISMLACGSFGPPESCGENIGGVADETLFGQYFASMELVSANTWQPGEQSENGMIFPAEEPLLIMFDAKSDVEVRACIQNTAGGSGKLALDQALPFLTGTNEFPLGAFQPGGYVIRVIVENTLVKNFPFSVK
jgi:hypothetical protein